MIKTLFSWKQSGTKDWLWQRVTALIVLLYISLIGGFWFFNAAATLTSWQHFMLAPSMRILGSLAFIAFAEHAWVGLWTVFTDYIHASPVRYIALFVTIILLALYLITAMLILWRPL